MPTNPLEPALTLNQWRYPVRIMDYDYDSTIAGAGEVSLTDGALELTSHEAGRFAVFSAPPILSVVIALANAALPDDDPRKITREHVGLIRSAARVFLAMPLRDADELESLADALESYLPPESKP